MSGVVDPFAAPYFARSLATAEALRAAPALWRIGDYTVVAELTESVLVARQEDGNLVVLKGSPPGSELSAEQLARREAEALRLHQYGFSGVLPIVEVLSRFSDGIDYLCLPYCPGGTLRDRLAEGPVPVAELAFHGLSLACALGRLHEQGLVHGDVKPENVLFAHGEDGINLSDGWRTVLADLETVVAAGGPSSWRLTEAYAAPEQLLGAAAGPAMDVWAWGRTLRDGLGGPTAGWEWLTELVTRALAGEPEARPGMPEIIAEFGRRIGFGPADGVRLGAAGAATWYPFTALPASLESWERAPDVHMARFSMRWHAWLPECHRLLQVGTPPALLRIEELTGKALADPETPHRIRLQILSVLGQALAQLVETTGDPAALTRLRAFARQWELTGEFESEVDTALLAQAWLLLDEPTRALPYVRRSYRADPDESGARATMRLYYLVTGELRMAAAVSGNHVDTDPDHLQLRWFSIHLIDLLATDCLAELAEVADVLAGTRMDVAVLIGCVLAGRLGPVTANAEWVALREHFQTVHRGTSLQKLTLLTEAAFQRGEFDYARLRADYARRRPVARRPVHHRERAMLEAVALQRDPAERGLGARLANRAELWVADGRPDDPLLGLDLVAAHRWADRSTPAARELLARSESALSEVLADPRHCGECRIEELLLNLAVCGWCHRTLCGRCVTETCWCGGDFA